MSNIVIATIDEQRVVVAYTPFYNEAELDRAMLAASKSPAEKKMKVVVISEKDARESMITEKPISF